MNLFSNQVDLALVPRLAQLPVETEATWTAPEAPAVPIEAAYETARRALRDMTAHDAARQQVRVAQRFAVEFARVSDYYVQAIEQLERRRARELRRAELDPAAGRRAATAAGDAGSRTGGGRAAGADALAHKIEATRGERERKLRELGESYGIRIRARLASVRWLWQPKVFFKALLDRGSVTRTLLLAYDGSLERLEPPTCEACRQRTTRLRASADARLLCPACAAE